MNDQKRSRQRKIERRLKIPFDEPQEYKNNLKARLQDFYAEWVK